MAETGTGAVTKAATTARGAAGQAATTVKKSAKKAGGKAKATKGAGAIARADALHYDVEVNKRGLSTKALTKTLNERWENGWRLAHVLEQRGNTVLVFEKRS